MLLEMLGGQTAPAQLELSPQLILRRSCGCTLASITQAATDHTKLRTTPNSSLSSHREQIVQEIKETVQKKLAEMAGSKEGQEQLGRGIELVSHVLD